MSSLTEEKQELSDQLQLQLDLSRQKLAELEQAAEEAECRMEAIIGEKNHLIEDLQLQLDNTEKQLKASRAFVDVSGSFITKSGLFWK